MFHARGSLFQTILSRAQRLLDFTDDALGDASGLEPHPHRTPLGWARERRPGMVAAPPAHCISPVKPVPVWDAAPRRRWTADQVHR
jgi:hypothetical protein